ncbi:MFS transporter [Streptomyces sp. NPDC048603]|uniref:MFS transporter n=1 Tax=Streptomyces sp. NPDC048603 TaxID=3365577 RepID=UPI00371BBE3A
MARVRSAGDGPGRARRAGRAVGRALRRPAGGAVRSIRRVTHARGAGESGLGRLIELHAINGAGDVMITVALASTVFFSVPTDEARGRVALYLAITMAPFVLLAPVIGPLLDRLPHGRRAAMAAAMLARALLAVIMSAAVATGGPVLYPAALGVLVASKAYGVLRSVAVPRLLPRGFSLVKANSRVTLAGLLATAVAAPAGALLHLVGPRWPLYGACAVFLAGTFAALRLPHEVDRAARPGSVPAPLAEALPAPVPDGHPASFPDALHDPFPDARPAPLPDALRAPLPEPRPQPGAQPRAQPRAQPGAQPCEPPRLGLRTVGASVLCGLCATAAMRCLSGFLVFFLGFLLREHPLAGQSTAVSLGIVGVAAGVGNACGTAVGAWLRARPPETIVAAVLCLTFCVAVSAAVFFSGPMVAVLGATAGFSQALAKPSLDAMIQRDVPEGVRTSAFARSETVLQTAWVLGGAIAMTLPLNGVLGLSAAAALLAAGTTMALRGLLLSPTRSHRPSVA